MAEKTTVVSSRLLNDVYDRLDVLSKKNKIAISTMINQILTRYTTFVEPRLSRHDLLFPKSLLLDFLKHVPQEEYESIASGYIQEHVLYLRSQYEELNFPLVDREYRNFHEYNFLNISVFEHLGYNIYKIYHENGQNFSDMFFSLSREFFEVCGFQVKDSEVTENQYSFTVIF